MKIRHYLTLLSISILVFSCQTKPKKALKVSKLFSNQMVLQQKQKVNFWGEYSPEEEVTISSSWGEEVSTKTDSSGLWKTKLDTPEAGGPYSIKIITNDSTIVIEDVLIGEVWLASGQSNMEMPLKGWPPNDYILNSDKEIAAANYPEIRMLTVERNLSSVPLDTIKGQWVAASPETAGDFSSTAYFFARKLHQELKVPVGIIHSSWGGTVAEAWTSSDYLKKLTVFDKNISELESQEFKDEIVNTENWFKKWPMSAIPETDKEWQEISFDDTAAADAEFDDSKWSDINLPGRFDELGSGSFDGAIWLRKEFSISDISSDYVLKIKAIDDMDATYVNGEKIGGLAGAGFHATAREMTLPKSLLVKGKNTIAIRAIDVWGPGTINGPMTISNAAGAKISLEGIWKSQLIAETFRGNFYTYDLKTGTSDRPEIHQMHPNLPTVLHNAMINPLVPYDIKGAIWYQGESNVGRAEQYKKLFPSMIEDWRDKWGSEFPFYFVQIAPFTYNPNLDEQVSQKLRDAQRFSLKTAKTGMVVTLDIGNPTNIHPANKQDVGKRLAGLALTNDYGKDLVSSGPLFKKIERLGNKMSIEFDHIGSGLVSSENGLSDFEIAGSDKNYVLATAKIAGDKVEVSSISVVNPKYVRYAWRDDSQASLFNKEGLPASSFTSEEE